MSRPKGRGDAWTEERGTSDEGPPPEAARPARRRPGDVQVRALVGHLQPDHGPVRPISQLAISLTHDAAPPPGFSA